jgi:hypothetical protein
MVFSLRFHPLKLTSGRPTRDVFQVGL